MRVSGLGKVSRDKWRRTRTSNNTIAADPDERNRRHSHREAPKRSQHEPLEHKAESQGNQLWSHKHPCQQARQERPEGVESITTKLISHRRLSSQVHQSPQNKHDKHSHEARWPSQRETPGRLGKFMPLISYNASVGINKKTKTRTTTTKITSKIALSTSATTTITVIVVKTSRARTRASSAASDGKDNANKSSDYWSAGNYHLVVLSKKRMGDVPHKSPGKKALVIRNLDTQKEMFRCFCIYLVPWTWRLTTSSVMTSAWTPLSWVLEGNRKLYCSLH